uniref:Cytochrome c oxidase subunit 3 n=1 Tax=Trichosporon inkin TaxID=82517 RepID=A0A7S8WVE7_9TREE|nr:cytochrome c oxidase subunit 3 [Trichosporon inkin]QPF23691.1 cytochrome c oxidase subunit 3 [Trichosporon inkin]
MNINRLKKQFQPYPYHMVEVSPWPLLTSFAVLSMMIGAVLYFNSIQNGGILLTLGFLSTFFAFVLWFRDITTEGTYLGDHTLTVQKGLTMGVALFSVTEPFFFLSIFWAYFHSSLAPTVELGSHWPPRGIEPMNPFAIPLFNTFLLLSSGATVTYPHHALIRGNRAATILGCTMTLVLAILFTACQGLEYVNATFTIADGRYGSCFFFGTGFHGLHVIIGTLFIGVAFYRIIRYHLTNFHHIGFEASILYWHFVDVVWLFLYVSIYWSGS